MMKLQIPYNKIQMNIEIPDANFQGVLESHPADCVMEGSLVLKIGLVSFLCLHNR